MADSDFATVRVVKEIVALCNSIFTSLTTSITASFTATLALRTVRIPTLLSPWINYGGGFGGVNYRRNAVGLVTIEGLMQAPTGTSTSGTIFTLLDGYRPAAHLMFTCWSGGGAYRVDIMSTGDVVISGGNTAFTSFSGISFYAE